jgi:hypothetical protein
MSSGRSRERDIPVTAVSLLRRFVEVPLGSIAPNPGTKAPFVQVASVAVDHLSLAVQLLRNQCLDHWKSGAAVYSAGDTNRI